MADVDTRQTAILARDAALLTDTVREAGALALSLFRTELKNWTKGASSPVSEADIAVNDLLEARLRSATPDYGWLSEESVDDDDAARQARWSGSSIRSTAPAPISPAATTGASAWRWWRMPRRCWRRCSRRPATNFSSPRAGRARRSTDAPVRATAGDRAGFFPHRRSEAAGASG